MATDDEYDHIVENLQSVLKLNARYEDNPYVKQCMKECSIIFIYGTYVSGGEADAKFSLGEICNLLQAVSLPNNARKFCRQMENCMRAWNYIQET